jgi:hypothetical protein
MPKAEGVAIGFLPFRAGFLLLTVTGCAPSVPQPALNPAHTENLTKIERAFDQAFEKLGRAPENADQLKPFLQEYGEPEEILRSPHDGQPYEIIWGVNFRKVRFSMPPPIVAYEKQGVNGKRYVLTVMGVVAMTDKEFAKAKMIERRPPE